MMMIIVYVIKAIMSPTCMVPRSAPWAPLQTMSTLTQFMIIIMAGIMKVMHRLVKSWVRIRSVLAWSKRCSSCFSREKARITLRPVRISRLTRLSRSTSTCIFRNRGRARAISATTTARTAPTATPMIQPMPVRVVETMRMPPMPTMGA